MKTTAGEYRQKREKIKFVSSSVDSVQNHPGGLTIPGQKKVVDTSTLELSDAKSRWLGEGLPYVIEQDTEPTRGENITP